MFSNFYRLNLHNKTWVVLAYLRWGIGINPFKYWTSNDFSYGYRKCMFVDFFIES